jgi:hypothetical protein
MRRKKEVTTQAKKKKARLRVKRGGCELRDALSHHRRCSSVLLCCYSSSVPGHCCSRSLPSCFRLFSVSRPPSLSLSLSNTHTHTHTHTHIVRPNCSAPPLLARSNARSTKADGRAHTLIKVRQRRGYERLA